MSKLPEPVVTVRTSSFGFGFGTVTLEQFFSLPDGTKLFTEDQVHCAIAAARMEGAPYSAPPAKPEVAPLPNPKYQVSLPSGGWVGGWSFAQVDQVRADACAVGYKRAKMDVEEQAAADKTLAETKAPNLGGALPAIARALEAIAGSTALDFDPRTRGYIRKSVATIVAAAGRVA
jgi:hypothetical protein